MNARPRCALLTSLLFLVSGTLLAGCHEATPGPADAAPPPPVRPTAADPHDWCAEHAVPESMCTLCNPELEPRFKAAGDWCAEHRLPESVCPRCNPLAPPGAAAAAPADWCAGHGLPESKCTQCNPELKQGFIERGDWCAAHSFPESACPECNPRTPPAGAPRAVPFAPGTRIRLASPEIAEAAGIVAVPATTVDFGDRVEAPARIEFDRNRVAEVRAPFTGLVREVRVDLGQQVEAGDTLFVLESAHIGDLQARRGAARERVRAARANLKRQKGLRSAGIASERALELGEQEVQAAAAALRSIEQSLRISGAAGGRRGRFEVTASITGTVIARPAVVGSSASETTPLATLADTSAMWAHIDVAERDLVGPGGAAVRAGQRVELEIDALAGRRFVGEVSWVPPSVDSRTRTVAVRAAVRNAHGLLRAHQFARATIEVSTHRGATAVPIEAVQRLDDGAIVFVATGEGVYEPRSVELGRADRRRVQVLGDVRAGDPVVTTGAFLLRTELRRDSIGAGCCEVEPPEAR